MLFTVKQKKKTDQDDLDNETTAIEKKRHFHLAYAGVVAFIGMSMVNSTIQIVPVMCMMIIYAAIISSTLIPLPLPVKFSFIEKSKAIANKQYPRGVSCVGASKKQQRKK